MSYRYQFFADFYPSHKKAFYAQQPSPAALPYDEQFAALWRDGYHWLHFLGRELQASGYLVNHVATNVEPVQRQWARENDLTLHDNDDWYHNIALAQMKAFQPDVLFAPYFDADFISHCREEVPSLRLIIGWAGEPIRDAGFFRNHNLMLTCVQEHINYYHDAGLPTELMYHAFETTILDAVDTSHPKDIPFGFAGSMNWGDLQHNQRTVFLHDLQQASDLQIFSAVPDLVGGYFAQDWKKPLQQMYYNALHSMSQAGLDGIVQHLPRADVFYRYQKRIPYIDIFAELRKNAHPPAFGVAMYNLLHRMQVAFNRHAWSAFASNMRLFEVTGVGSCLLTDWKQNMGELFADDEVVTYRSLEDCVEKANYLRDHPDEAQAIAARGQRRTLAEHTTAHRAAQFDAIVRQYMQDR